jgi:outer membrane protein assembly factor BamB
MMHSIRALWLLPWLLMLAGCSIGGSRSLDVQPAPALDIEPATFAVTEDWSASVGAAAVPYHRLAISQRGGRVYVASADGQVSAIDHQNGESIWTQSLDAEISGGPSSTDTQVVVGTAGGEIVALDAEQGKLRWRASLSSEVLAPPAIGQEHVVARTGDGRVFALSNRDGAQQWLYSRSVPALSLRGHSAPVLVPDGVIAGFDHGRLSALDLQTGEPVWEATIAVPQGRTDLERMVDLDADPVVDRGDLFAGTYQGRLVGP